MPTDHNIMWWRLEVVLLSLSPCCRREGEGAAAAHVDRAPMSFFSPPRSERATRHNHFVFSPSSDFPKSPIPLFMASPGRQRDAGAAPAGHGPLASPGMLFDPISRLASPMGALLPSSSDLPAPGMQLGGVPRGFGSPKVCALLLPVPVLQHLWFRPHQACMAGSDDHDACFQLNLFVAI